MNKPNSFAALATTAIIAGCATTPHYPEGHDPEELLEECRDATTTISKEIRKLAKEIAELALVLSPELGETIAKKGASLSELDVLECTTGYYLEGIPIANEESPVSSQASCVNASRLHGKYRGLASNYGIWEWGHANPNDDYPISGHFTNCVDNLEKRNLELEALRTVRERFAKAAKENPPFQDMKARLRRVQQK